MRVYYLKTLKKLSIYPLGNTPSAPSVGHSQEDWEWVEVEEALKNWRNWGKPGTRYGHLPVVEEKLLRRVDSPEVLGSEEISEAELLKVKRTRREVLGE